MNSMPGSIGSEPLSPIVEAQLAIADAELGVETQLRSLLRKGIAVHTSAMLQVEQAAAEWMFTKGMAKLMFATGTLAQGLNLPAVAVVVSGSKLAQQEESGDADEVAGVTRANELILNGFGRAGRPGFSNQGIVILVGDKWTPVRVGARNDGKKILGDYPVLGEPDASILVRSPIEMFLDNLLAIEGEADASTLEVALTSLLCAVEGDEENAGTVLRRTFAGYRKRAVFTPQQAIMATQRLGDLKKRFLEREDVPVWMPQAAMKAGVEFFRAQRMWEAYRQRGLVGPERASSLTVRKWFEVLIDVLSNMPPQRTFAYSEQKAVETPRAKLRALASKVREDELDAIPWARPDGWQDAWEELGSIVLAYMEGLPFTQIGAALLRKPSDEFFSRRTNPASGIPAVFKFISEVIERLLAVDAGCFLALHECWLNSEHPELTVPEALQALPLCIRNGCDDLEVLAWYRSGFRQRVSAHALADAFPLPPDIFGDAERARAVHHAKRIWLGEPAVTSSSLLDFARVLVVDGNSERM